MKILLTTVSFDPVRGGGTTERTRHLASSLRAAGHTVTVAAIEPGPVQAELERAGVVTYATGRLVRRVPRIDPRRLWTLVARSDAVHVLGYWNLLSVATAFLARLQRKPYAFSAAGELSNLSSLRLIAMLFHQLVGRQMLAGASVVVAITELERSIIGRSTGRSLADIVVLPNGVADISIAPAAPASLPVGPFALFLGRLAPIKGPDLLVEAFARIAADFPAAHLVIAGPDFGLGGDLRRAVHALALEKRIVFTGHLGEAARTAALQQSAFLVVPSRSEAMSMVALEAGIQGKPVLATDTCGLDALVDTGGGIVCAPTVEGLSRGLRDMFTAADLAGQGMRWRDFVRANYRWPDIAERLVALLKGSMS